MVHYPYCSGQELFYYSEIIYFAVAEPGFPPKWGSQPSREAPTYNFAKIFQKLYEIERIWTREARLQFFLYVDPPLLWTDYLRKTT